MSTPADCYLELAEVLSELNNPRLRGGLIDASSFCVESRASSQIAVFIASPSPQSSNLEPPAG
jgi:hypothetical protein